MGIPITPDDPIDGGIPTCFEFMPDFVFVTFVNAGTTLTGTLPRTDFGNEVFYIGLLTSDPFDANCILIFNFEGSGDCWWGVDTSGEGRVPNQQCDIPVTDTHPNGDTILVEGVPA